MNITDALKKALREVDDDDDFVLGILCFADNEEDRKVILDFIRNDDDVSHETVTVLALDLHDARYGEPEYEED